MKHTPSVPSFLLSSVMEAVVLYEYKKDRNDEFDMKVGMVIPIIKEVRS